MQCMRLHLDCIGNLAQDQSILLTSFVCTDTAKYRNRILNEERISPERS